VGSRGGPLPPFVLLHCHCCGCSCCHLLLSSFPPSSSSSLIVFIVPLHPPLLLLFSLVTIIPPPSHPLCHRVVIACYCCHIIIACCCCHVIVVCHCCMPSSLHCHLLLPGGVVVCCSFTMSPLAMWQLQIMLEEGRG
jgi:hypothetical protein